MAMSPQLLEMQLKAGAWGVSVSTVSQARVYRAFGADRILLANELVEPAALSWVAAQLDADEKSQFLCLVDSLQGVALMEDALRRNGIGRRLPVLVEMGVPGGRTGCRSLEDAVRVGRAVMSSSTLLLAGVEGYEGVIGSDREISTIQAIDDYLLRVRRLVEELNSIGGFDGVERVVVTAGGSSFFDRVVHVLAGGWEQVGKPVQLLLRSGAYAAHDCGFYSRLSPLRDQLQPALEIWARVLSRPEPTLAILGFGRRDAPFDIDLPVPKWIHSRSGGLQAAGPDVAVSNINDQHAFLRVDSAQDLAPGDLVGCSIIHPCTAFDKWPLVPMVDEDYRVIGALRTYF
jgi:D-serine deaminase-like pyridoxal phosphate-dependent protein